MTTEMKEVNPQDLISMLTGSQPSVAPAGDTPALLVRIVQFAVVAGISPVELVGTLHHMQEDAKPEDLVDAIAIATITPKERAMDTLPETFADLRKEPAYEMARDLVEKCKAAGVRVSDAYDAVRHDMAVYFGFHQCDESVVKEVLEEVAKADNLPERMQEPARSVLNQLIESGRPVSVIAPDGSVETYNQRDETDDESDGTDDDN